MMTQPKSDIILKRSVLSILHYRRSVITYLHIIIILFSRTLSAAAAALTRAHHHHHHRGVSCNSNICIILYLPLFPVAAPPPPPPPPNAVFRDGRAINHYLGTVYIQQRTRHVYHWSSAFSRARQTDFPVPPRHRRRRHRANVVFPRVTDK